MAEDLGSIGQAYVDIQLKTDGVNAQINAFGTSMASSGEAIGTSFVAGFSQALKDFDLKEFGEKLKDVGKDLKEIGVGISEFISLPIAELGFAAFESAEKVEGAMHQIQVATGATGEALEELGGSFKSVTVNVPNSMEDVGAAIGALHTRTGLTGEALEALATQLLNVSRMTGSSVTDNVVATTRLFGIWKISTDDQAGSLNYLWHIAQQSGIGFTTLNQLLVGSAIPLQQLGFNFEQSAAMLGQFEKSGVSSEAGLTALNIAVRKLATAGVKDLAAGFQELQNRIRGAKTDSDAMAIGADVFGRSAVKLTGAIRDGSISFEELERNAKAMTSTINDDGKATLLFTDRLTMLAHQMAVAMAPAGDALIKTFTNLLPLLQTGVGWVGSLGSAFANLPPSLQLTIIGAGGLLAALGPVVLIAGAFIKSLGAIMLAFEGLGIGMATVTAAMAALGAVAAPVGIALGAIAAIGLGVWALGLGDDLKGLVGDVWELTKSFGRLAESAVHVGLSIGAALWADAKAGIYGVGQAIDEVVGRDNWKRFWANVQGAAIVLAAKPLLDVRAGVQDTGNLANTLSGSADVATPRLRPAGVTAGVQSISDMAHALDVLRSSGGLTAAELTKLQAQFKANGIVVDQNQLGNAKYVDALAKVGGAAKLTAEDLAKLDKLTRPKDDEYGKALEELEKKGAKEAAQQNLLAAAIAKLESQGKSAAEIVAIYGQEILKAGQYADATGHALNPLIEKYAVQAESTEHTTAAMKALEKQQSENAKKDIEEARALEDMNFLTRAYLPTLLELAVATRAYDTEISRLNQSSDLLQGTLSRNLNQMLMLRNLAAGRDSGAIPLGALETPAIAAPAGGSGPVSFDRMSTQAQSAANAIDAYRNSVRDAVGLVDQLRRETDANGNALYTEKDILRELGPQLVSAGQAAREMGQKLDPATQKLIDQAQAAEDARKSAEDWRNAWSTAMGNLSANFAKGMSDIIFQAKGMGSVLKGTFSQLAHSITDVFFAELFHPVTQMLGQLGKNMADELSHALTGSQAPSGGILGGIGSITGGNNSGGGGLFGQIAGYFRGGNKSSAPSVAIGNDLPSQGGFTGGLDDYTWSGDFGAPRIQELGQTAGLASQAMSSFGSNTQKATSSFGGLSGTMGKFSGAMNIAGGVVGIFNGVLDAIKKIGSMTGQGRKTADDIVPAQNALTDNGLVILKGLGEKQAAGTLSAADIATAKSRIGELKTNYYAREKDLSDSTAKDNKTAQKALSQSLKTVADVTTHWDDVLLGFTPQVADPAASAASSAGKISGRVDFTPFVRAVERFDKAIAGWLKPAAAGAIPVPANTAAALTATASAPITLQPQYNIAINGSDLSIQEMRDKILPELQTWAENNTRGFMSAFTLALKKSQAGIVTA